MQTNKGFKIMTNNDLKELTYFLDKYNMKYEVVGDSVVADTVNLDGRGITHIPYSIWYLKCKSLWLHDNNLTALPASIGSLECESLYLYNNPLTSESIELLAKLKSNGVNVIYQPTKQTNKIMEKCNNMVDPDHYKKGAFQTIDVIEDFLDNEFRLLTAKQKYSIGNALKYISRAGLKGSMPEDAITDLKKAENYIHRAITGEWIDAS